jgi:D-3-phosphoglycerate dehydrogenase
LVGEKFLRAMKKTAYILNCARGGIVDEGALVKALHEGWIAGAALDVYESEPPAGRPILSAPRVHFTPHLGASTDEAQTKAGLMVARSILDFFGGKAPANRVV